LLVFNYCPILAPNIELVLVPVVAGGVPKLHVYVFIDPAPSVSEVGLVIVPAVGCPITGVPPKLTDSLLSVKLVLVKYEVVTEPIGAAAPVKGDRAGSCL
jgi:hypothetical protein